MKPNGRATKYLAHMIALSTIYCNTNNANESPSF